jgi:CrcB protein
MATVISIAVFGAAGCLARYWISSTVNRLMGLGAFPYGTLAVNLIGAFFIGLVMELSLRSTMLSHGMKVALTIGFMGGLTTFSTFSVETFVLIEKGHFFVALMNVLISVTLCLLATWLGIVAVRSV